MTEEIGAQAEFIVPYELRPILFDGHARVSIETASLITSRGRHIRHDVGGPLIVESHAWRKVIPALMLRAHRIHNRIARISKETRFKLLYVVRKAKTRGNSQAFCKLVICLTITGVAIRGRAPIEVDTISAIRDQGR